MDFIKYFKQLQDKQVVERTETETTTSAANATNTGTTQTTAASTTSAQAGTTHTDTTSTTHTPGHTADTTHNITPTHTSTAAKEIEHAANMISAYRSILAPDQKAALENLKKIKHEIDQPKENSPDDRFAKIKANLGPAECHQTIREERWNSEVYCPYCFSTDIERMPPSSQISVYNFRYLCVACHSRFNDDSKSPFEIKIPSLETWIQCWFLLGCTESFEYIAVKLNLDVDEVKQMAAELRQIFKAQQPLTRLMSYEAWHKAHAEKVSARISNEIITKKQQELHQGETSKQPLDTAELRRQKERKKLTSNDGPNKGRPQPKF